MSERIASGRLSAWLLIVVTMTALNYGAQASGGTETSGDELFQWSFAVSSAASIAILLGLTLLIARRRPDLRALRRPRSWGSPLTIAVGGVIAALVVGSLVTTLGGDPGDEQGILSGGWQSGHLAAFVASVSMLAILTPVTEELLIRGVGFGLLRPLGAHWAIFLSAFAWALMHGLFTGFPIILALGLGLGYARERAGSVVPGILIHGFYNGLAIGLSFTLH